MADDDSSEMNRWLRGGTSERESQARMSRRFFGDPEPQQEPPGVSTDGTTAPDRAHNEEDTHGQGT